MSPPAPGVAGRARGERAARLATTDRLRQDRRHARPDAAVRRRLVDPGGRRERRVAVPDAVHANIAGALAAGKHVLLTGKRGAGKTALALAVARAAAQAGRADGATVVTAAPSNELVVDAASRGRWVIADELDQADPDAALAPLSTLLAGVPITLGDDEAVPADGWRLIATWNGDAPPKAAILRRFAVVEVLPPASDELRRLLDEAANGDAVAIRAAERLNEAGLGAGVLIDAARHAATRHAVAPADEATLAQELFAAYVAPLQP